MSLYKAKRKKKNIYREKVDISHNPLLSPTNISTEQRCLPLLFSFM